MGAFYWTSKLGFWSLSSLSPFAGHRPLWFTLVLSRAQSKYFFIGRLLFTCLCCVSCCWQRTNGQFFQCLCWFVCHCVCWRPSLKILSWTECPQHLHNQWWTLLLALISGSDSVPLDSCKWHQAWQSKSFLYGLPTAALNRVCVCVCARVCVKTPTLPIILCDPSLLPFFHLFFHLFIV